MLTSQGHNFCIQYSFGVHDISLERYKWEEKILEILGNPLVALIPLKVYKQCLGP